MKIVCRFVCIAPLLLMMAAIFWLSHQSGDSIHLPKIPGVDKIGHAVLYGLLAMTVLWYYNTPRWIPIKSAPPPLPKNTVACKTVLFCLLYGMSDEIHQAFIPLRSVSAFDLLADVTGALLVTSSWLQYRSFQRKKY